MLCFCKTFTLFRIFVLTFLTFKNLENFRIFCMFCMFCKSLCKVAYQIFTSNYTIIFLVHHFIFLKFTFNFRGQNFYKQNKLSIIAISIVGLILVFAVDTILKVLYFFIFVLTIYKFVKIIYNYFYIVNDSFL